MIAVTSQADGTSATSSRDQKLEHLFQFVNRRFFESKIRAYPQWEIPRGTVSTFTGTTGLVLTPGHPLYSQFEKATGLLRQGRQDEAVTPLTACADAGHPESELLLSHLLKRRGNERWQHYASAYNRHLESRRSVPAACYYPDSCVIALHPYLLDRNAPQLVLKYLLYHECCHQLIPARGDDPHPPAFLQWEMRAPHRARALEWLEKEGFPTLTANTHD